MNTKDKKALTKLSLGTRYSVRTVEKQKDKINIHDLATGKDFITSDFEEAANQIKQIKKADK